MEIEALQTVAMVLSEMIAAARLVDGAPQPTSQRGPFRLGGLKLVAGMARGEAVFHQPRVVVEHMVAEDTEAERDRVYSAFRKMREQIDAMTKEAEFGTAGEHQEILETYKMFAYDEGWSRRINEAIDSGLTAEAAIERVQQRTRARMQDIDDPLLKDRMHDLEDLSNRLLRIVSGRFGTAAQTGLARDTVLIARNLGPAELLEYDRRRLKAVARGGLAHGPHDHRRPGHGRAGRRADLGHPAQRRGRRADPVDMDNGSVIVRPNRALPSGSNIGFRRGRSGGPDSRPPATAGRHAGRCSCQRHGQRRPCRGRGEPGSDGRRRDRPVSHRVPVPRLGNAARTREAAAARKVPAGDKPVVFRTVDIGGDKALPYLTDVRDEAENPAMGWRALRLSLERSTLMKAQARALIEATGGKVLRVMFLMISLEPEFDEARALFEEQIDWARKPPQAVSRVEFGAMLEVPSLAEVLDLLLPKIDFCP